MILLRATRQWFQSKIENYYRNLYTSDLTFSETAYDTFTDSVQSP